MNKIKKRVISIFLIAATILIIAGCCFIIKNHPAKLGEILIKMNLSEKPAAIAPTVAWQTYRDETNGFEIGYPGYYSKKEYLPAGDNGNHFCAPQVGQSLRISSDKDLNSNTYTFAVYSNPQGLSIKDFFVCQGKTTNGNGFNEADIVNILATGVGKQENGATVFTLSDSSKDALIPSGENIIEISTRKKQNGLVNTDEFNEMLSTFIFSDIPSSSSKENKDQLFCDANVKNEYGGGLLAFSLPFKEKNGDNGELLLGCARRTASWQNKPLPFENVSLYHVDKDANGNYQAVWNGNTGESGIVGDGLEWNLFSGASSAGDINGDGLNEIILAGSRSGDACTFQCSDNCIYAPSEKNIFCISQCFGWEKSSAIISETATQDCPEVKIVPQAEGDTCHNDTYETLCFKGNDLKDPKYKVLRDYLIKIGKGSGG